LIGTCTTCPTDSACKFGFECIVSKRLGSLYKPGCSRYTSGGCVQGPGRAAVFLANGIAA
jgi:hypothetical protein